MMKRQTLKVIKRILFYTFLVLALFVGIELYRVFMMMNPQSDFTEVFTLTIGISPFIFLGIVAGVMISFPILITAFELYFTFATSYIIVESSKGSIMLSDTAIESFVRDTVNGLAGVDSVEVSVDVFKENQIGIKLWLGTDEKNDFVRFSERIQQRVVQDLEFNFGIRKFKFFKVFLESTDINSAAKGYKVQYK